MKYLMNKYRLALLVFVISLSVRLVYYAYSGDWQNPLQRMMIEEVAIAQHLAEGNGYASPFAETEEIAKTMKSAHSPPGYPFLLSLLLRVFDDDKIAYRISQISGGILGALAVAVIAHLSFANFGSTAGIVTGVLGALLPPLVYRSPVLYDTPYIMLGISLCLLTVSTSFFSVNILRSLLLGAMAGVFSLFNPVIMPLYFGVIIVEGCKQASTSGRIKYIVLGGLAWLCILMPWTVRNWNAFHRFIPLRNNVPLELWVGQLPESDGTTWGGGKRHPNFNLEERRIINQLGEIQYYDMRGREFAESVRNDPVSFMKRTLVRVKLYWLGEFDKSPLGASAGSKGIIAGIIKYAIQIALVLLTVIGLLKDNNRRAAVTGFICLLIMPVPYYFTHVCAAYKVPVLLLQVYWAGSGAKYIISLINSSNDKDGSKS